MDTNNIQNYLAERLLEIEALQINVEQPYTWSSGWKSPVYCDNRKALSYPDIRECVKIQLVNMIKKHFPAIEVVAGVSTAGIPHAYGAADLLKMPLIYVRPEPKRHGMGNQIEGVLKRGQKVVVIEDLVSTGKSSLRVVEVLREKGAEIVGMCALFTYGFPVAEEAFAKANVLLHTISNYSALIKMAETKRFITSEHIESLEKWNLAPESWGQ